MFKVLLCTFSLIIMVSRLCIQIKYRKGVFDDDAAEIIFQKSIVLSLP